MRSELRTFDNVEAIRNEIVRRARILLRPKRTPTVCTDVLHGSNWAYFSRKFVHSQNGIQVTEDDLAAMVRSMVYDSIDYS